MDFLTKMMTHSNETSKYLLSSDQTLSGMSLEERVANWHFNHLDSDRNGRVSRRELRPLRNTLKSDLDLRGCGKRIQIHCDANSDLQIDLAEWNLCVGAKKGIFTIV
jgi:Ca2+-binding EF-hand superfamily protein